jgi:hypothetical protein
MTLPVGPDEKRRLKETDIDPSGELSSDRTGETENPGTGRQGSNQPAENREDPTPSDGRPSEDRESENAPQPGHEE